MNTWANEGSTGAGLLYFAVATSRLLIDCVAPTNAVLLPFLTTRLAAGRPLRPVRPPVHVPDQPLRLRLLLRERPHHRLPKTAGRKYSRNLFRVEKFVPDRKVMNVPLKT